MKFGIGQPVPRKEDPTLVRGEGRYTDDCSLAGPGLRRLRAQPPRARRHQGHRHRGGPGDAGRARGLHRRGPRGGGARPPAVRSFEFKNRDGTPMTKPPHPALPSDRVRYVGEPVAFVVAETPRAGPRRRRGGRARHRASCRPSRPAEAAAPGAPQLYDEVPGNLVLDYHFGDSAKVAAAFARAAHVDAARALATTASS